MTSGIGLDRLLELIEGGAQVVDVLPEAEYEDAHLPGAINIPLKQLDANSTSDIDTPRQVRTSRQNGNTRIVLGSLNPQRR